MRAVRARRTMLWGGIGLLLALPLLAMQVTSEVNWTPADFACAAVLLGAAAALYEIAAGRVRDPNRLAIVGAALVAAVVLIWAEGAVGVF